ncbi:MAG: PilZ domain-containing protein [Candidatus Acidiferrales bacterium]
MLNGSNGSAKKSAGSSAKADERRTFPRYTLSAEAEVVEAQSRTKMNARVSDLSRMGCYVEMMSPFPLGANLKMRIMKNKTPFVAHGQVAYSSGGMGMGVRFTTLDPDQILLLEKWLGELSGTLPFDDEASEDGAHGHASHGNGNETSYVLNEVIIALMRKGVLSDGEGKTMLQKLTH